MYETGGMGRRNHFSPQMLERWQETAGGDARLYKVTSAKSSQYHWDMNYVAIITVLYCHLLRWDPITSMSDSPPWHCCRGKLGVSHQQLSLSSLGAAISFPGEYFAILPFEHLLKHTQCPTTLTRKTTYLLHFMFWGQLVGWWIAKEHFIADKYNCWK